MLDLEAVRQRLQEFEEWLDTKSGEPPVSLDVMARDLRILMREVEELRSLCKHPHVLQLQNEAGEYIPAFACVNCHTVVTSDDLEALNTDSYNDE